MPISNNPTRAGFSLIEMVIVLMILGIMSGVAAPRYTEAIAWRRCDLAARTLAADLRQAAIAAQQTSVPKTIEFDVDGNTYTAIDLPRTYSAQQRSQLAITIVSADFGGVPRITFDIYGRPSAAGTVVLESADHQRTLTIDTNGTIQP